MSLLAREVVPSNVVNDQDQGALATIAAALALTTTGLFLCIRLLIRWPWQSLFGSDDAAILLASDRTLLDHPMLAVLTSLRYSAWYIPSLY